MQDNGAERDDQGQERGAGAGARIDHPDQGGGLEQDHEIAAPGLEQSDVGPGGDQAEDGIRRGRRHLQEGDDKQKKRKGQAQGPTQDTFHHIASSWTPLMSAPGRRMPQESRESIQARLE